MRPLRWLLLAVLLACPLAYGLAFAREWSAVDAALDAGASWDYAAGRADWGQAHPFIPFAQRHPTFATTSAASLLAALFWLVLLRTVLRRSKAA